MLVKQLKMKQKNKNVTFLSMLLSKLVVTLLVVGKWVCTSWQKSDFEIQKHYQNEPRFNNVYSRNNVRKKKMGYML